MSTSVNSPRHLKVDACTHAPMLCLSFLMPQQMACTHGQSCWSAFMLWWLQSVAGSRTGPVGTEDMCFQAVQIDHRHVVPATALLAAMVGRVVGPELLHSHKRQHRSWRPWLQDAMTDLHTYGRKTEIRIVC